MDRKLNFFLSVLLALVFGMGLSTCSYASTANLDYFDTDFFESLVDYWNNNKNAFDRSDIYVNNMTITNLQTYFNSQKSNFKTYLESIGATEQNLIVVITNTSSLLLVSFYPTNNTIGDLEYLQINYYNDQGFTFNSVNYKSLNIKISYSGSISSNVDYIYNYKWSGTNSNPRFWCNYNSVTKSDIDITIPLFFGVNSKPLNVIYFKDRNDSIARSYFLNNYYDIQPPPVIPEEPSGEEGQEGTTGTITNNSGDKTGKVDLSGIEQGIGNINQNIDKTNEKLDGISGEIGKLNDNLTTVPDISDKTITSEDITNSFDFEFAEDPYANFWLELTTRTFWCFN